MYNFKIRNDGDCYDLNGGQAFDSLIDLLTYYMSVSLRPDALAFRVPVDSAPDDEPPAAAARPAYENVSAAGLHSMPASTSASPSVYVNVSPPPTAGPPSFTAQSVYANVPPPASASHAPTSTYVNVTLKRTAGRSESDSDDAPDPETGEGPPGRLRLKSGAFVDLLYPFVDVAPTCERWFHGPLTSEEARTMLAGAPALMCIPFCAAAAVRYVYSARYTYTCVAL